MNTYLYDVVADSGLLHRELVAAGHIVLAVYDKRPDPYCRVELADTDTVDPWPVVAAHVPGRLSDAERVLATIAGEVAQANDQALVAYTNYTALTAAQKDKILKALLGDYLVRNRGKYGG